MQFRLELPFARASDLLAAAIGMQFSAVTDSVCWTQEVLVLQCSQGVRILDFSHVAGYLVQVAKDSFGPGADATKEWFATLRLVLQQSDPATVLAELASSPASANWDTALGYLRNRQEMITYAGCSAAGYPIGSGCFDSANKLVVEARINGAGMRATPMHADALVASWALVASGR